MYGHIKKKRRRCSHTDASMSKGVTLVNNCIIAPSPTLLLSAWTDTRPKREAKRVHKQNMRAKRMGLPHTLTLAQWIDILNQHNWSCAWCGGTYESIDHVYPLSWGGGTTADNVLPSCIPCNHTRGVVSAGLHHEQQLASRGQWWLVHDLIETHRLIMKPKYDMLSPMQT